MTNKLFYKKYFTSHCQAMIIKVLFDSKHSKHPVDS